MKRRNRIRRPTHERNRTQVREVRVRANVRTVQHVVCAVGVIRRAVIIRRVVLEQTVDAERVLTNKPVNHRVRKLVAHARDVRANLVFQHRILVLRFIVELLVHENLRRHASARNFDFRLRPLVRRNATIVGRPHRRRRFRPNRGFECRAIVRGNHRHVVKHLNLLRDELNNPMGKVALRVEALHKVQIGQDACVIYCHLFVPFCFARFGRAPFP